MHSFHFPRHRLPWLILALLLGITALAYWPGTRGTFLLDDYPNLVQNSAFKNLQPTWGSFLAASLSSDSGPTHRPIAMGSFALNALASGGGKNIQRDATGMKWTNVAIHLLNGLLVYVLLRLILGEYRRLRPETTESTCEWAALAVTAAWLLAPINLTAVLYVIQRMTSLAATFSLLGLIAYVAGRKRLRSDGKSVRGWLGLFATALIWTPLAIFTKEIGALTMLYALVIEWTLFGLRQADGRRAKGLIAYFVLFLVVPAIIGMFWLLPPVFHSVDWEIRDFSLGERLLTEGRVIWHYLWWTLVPNINALTLFHDAFPVSKGLLNPWTTLLSWIGIAGLLAAGFLAKRRYPLVALGLFWFLAGQVMTGSVFPLELVFEHREYLPSVGLYAALFGTAIILVQKYARRRLAMAAIAMVIGLYGVALGLRSINWSNPLRQLAIAAHNHPDSPRATYAYGRLLTILSGVDPKLVPAAFKALEAAQKVPGQGILPDSTLIILANQSERPVKAAWYLDISDQLQRRAANPGDENALYSLVHCALRDKKPCKLDPLQIQIIFASALSRNPGNEGIRATYGNYLLNVAGQPDKARQLFQLLVTQHPGNASYHFDLGVTEVICGDMAAAKRQLEIVKRLNRLGMSNKQVKSLSDLIERAKKDSGTDG